MARPFETTEDTADKWFTDGGTMDILAVYHVYVGAESITKGHKQWEDFSVPLGALTGIRGIMGLVAVTTASYLVF